MKRYKILILDDDEIVAESFRDRLEQIGIYEVTTIFNPNAALELAKNDNFDAYLVDQRMPEMTGEEFIRKLIAIVPSPLIYVISAVDDDIMISAAQKDVEEGGLPIKKYIDKLDSNKDYVFSIDLKEDLREHLLKKDLLKVIDQNSAENRKIEHSLVMAKSKIYEMKKRDAAMTGALTVISAVNHELNNLNAIFDSKATLLEFLYDDAAGKIEEPYLQKISDIKAGIQSTSARFSESIRFMKTLMSMDTHDKKKEHKLEKLINAGLDLLRDDIKEKKITVAMNCSHNLIVNASEELLKHGFYQIIKNSVEAIDSNGGRIEINTSLIDNTGVITIIDDGRGIAETDLENVFIPFYNKGKIYGGKGGSIAHKIFVMNHLGSIRIETLHGSYQPPVGMKTKVTIMLPEAGIK